MKRLRYRLGAWLLRPHVVNLIVHYDNTTDELMTGANPSKDKVTRAKRCVYISIGLRYALDYERSLDDQSHRS